MQVRNWIGTLNGIDASFDAEGYLRTMVDVDWPSTPLVS